MIDYEKLGAFYLGRSYDMSARALRDETILYDSKDLTTHAVIVGMTGSGKTGLGVTLLEEAAIDQIPSIVIDPKGDMGNLLLGFPELRAEDFLPWVDHNEATRQGKTVEEFAADRAALWKRGLEEWHQQPERIQKFRDAVDVAIYTPGSDAGMQVTVLRSLAAPAAAILESSDALRERVTSAASGICTLLDLDADPIRSREHILISNVLDHSWKSGKSLTMASLIYAIQSPPFQKIGIMEVDQIFPPDERMQLAMTLNNVLASPGFAGWMQGEPLDIQRLLYTTEGKPRISILSIAHLSDHERMFFVTILLNEIIAWMRAQPGTSSLRALLYMDELFGYLPPTANPPSKTPLLTLLKQARAFGVGLVLATQNPVDLDYKALSNAGTWFLGRLQTERDKMRVLDGLEGATASAGVLFHRKRIEQILSGLASRTFLLNNVHEDEPVVFQTRWALSYLSGPLTREQISTLMADRKAAAPPPTNATLAVATAAAASTAAEASPLDGLEPHPPVLSSRIDQYFLTVARGVPREAPIRYEPALGGIGRVHFVDDDARVNETREIFRIYPAEDRMPSDPWENAEAFDSAPLEIDDEPAAESGFIKLAGDLTKSTRFTRWKTALKNKLYRDERVVLYECTTLQQFSTPGQSEGDFRVTLRQQAREQRDREIEKLRATYEDRFERLRERLRRAEKRVEDERQQSSSAWLSSAASALTALAGIFSRRSSVATKASRVGTAVRAGSRASEQSSDIGSAEDDARNLVDAIEDLEAELDAETARITSQFEPESLELTRYEVSPRRSDVSVDTVALLWRPWRADIDEPAWDAGVES